MNLNRCKSLEKILVNLLAKNNYVPVSTVDVVNNDELAPSISP